MSQLKVWIRMLRIKGKHFGRHLLYKRKVRQILYFTYNVPFPGGKGVSIYHVTSYFIVSSLGGESAALLRKYRCGATYREGDAASLAEAIGAAIRCEPLASRRMCEAEFDAASIYDAYVRFLI